MLKYSAIQTIIGEMTEEKIKELLNVLNDGFEILKLDTYFVLTGSDGEYKQEPNIICVLVKHRQEGDT